MTYNLKTGLGKSFKNTLVIWAVPAVLLLLDNYTQWVPEKYIVPVGGFIGFLSYLVKNFIGNK